MARAKSKLRNKVIIGAVVLIVIIAAILVIYNVGPTVSATGTSSLKVQPDEISVYVNIETRGMTAQIAQQLNSETRDDVLAALNNSGLNENEMKFGSYNIYPEYNWNNGKQELTGYVASQQIIVKLSNFSKVPSIIDKSVEKGALISYINFELSDAKQNEYKNKALQAAGIDAKMKAESSAAGVGKKLGRLVSVQSQEFRYPGPFVYYDSNTATSAGGSAEVAVKQAALNLAPQDIEVSASIVVEYKLSLF